MELLKRSSKKKPCTKKTKCPKTTKKTCFSKKTTTISNEDIARVAYQLYAQRGYNDGNDLTDWVEAEKILGT